MKVFSVKDVERVLKIPRSAIRSLVSGGFVAPARGRRRQYEFTFQDLVALRTARALMLARVSPRRISQALRQLRQSVPSSPESGNLRISASGTELVVRDESGPWRTPTGQFLLEFDVSVHDGQVEILDRSADKAKDAAILETPAAAAEAQESLFERALRLEDSSAEDAIHAYLNCLDQNPQDTAARINCGRLLHATQRVTDAESLYRAGLGEDCEENADLLFNLALVLEDTGRELEAVDMYKRALRCDEEFADAHFNLARLYQQLKMPRAAIRHFNCYRRLTS